MKLNTKYLTNQLTNTLTNIKNFLIYVLLHIIMLTFLIGGGYMMMNILIDKWWIILEFICGTSMMVCGIIMILTAIEITK